MPLKITCLTMYVEYNTFNDGEVAVGGKFGLIRVEVDDSLHDDKVLLEGLRLEQTRQLETGRPRTGTYGATTVWKASDWNRRGD